MAAINRVLRSIRQSIPTGVVLGRDAPGDGPVQFLPLSDALNAQLDAISAVRGSILYRGASAWAALAPGTAGQVLQTNGANADPSWAAAGGGEPWWFAPPTTSALSTGITTGTVSSIVEGDDTDVGLTFSANPATNNNVRMLLETAPSLPFTVTCRVLAHFRGNLGAAGHFGLAGVALRDSSSGRWTIFGASGVNRSACTSATVTTTITNTWTSPNLFTSVPVDGGWYRLTIDGSGDIEGFFSADGKTWMTMFTATAAQSAGAGVDQVGIGYGCRANATDNRLMGSFGYYDVA